MPVRGNVLLDTSVIIPYFKGNVAIRQCVQDCSTLYLPQMALGELYCGAYLSANQAKTLAEITSFLAAVVVLNPGLATADHYGQIRAALAKAGTPIPENDIWIAAIAREHKLPLAVRDIHFDRVAGLRILKW